jgi:superfamily II DNA or RNA helicase
MRSGGARVTLRLRTWQREALDDWRTRDPRDYLAVATPGSGKTTFALACALASLADAPHRRLVVVAPTRHLTGQWAAAAARVGLQLNPEWSPRSARLPADVHGAVLTYQQVATAPVAIARAAPGAFVVCDEIHHAGADRSWGDALATAFDGAERRLSLSGTPFRSDSAPIPFVRYENDEAVPDFQYGYADALGEGGVVRPVRFPRLDGHMEWRDGDGAGWQATFADPLARRRANQRLRTALSTGGEWLPSVLGAADAKLRHIRRDHPGAAGLVIADDQDHARAVAGLLRDRCGQPATVAVSDDPAASRRIGAFADSDAPWLVAVRMVSEGVDIPRLRVGVFATATTTELFFRQAVGRLVRWTPGLAEQTAWLFVPDDPRLVGMAARIAEERRHRLRRDDVGDAESEDDDEPSPPEPPAEPPPDGQMALFTALSAVALGEPADDGAAASSGAPPGDEAPSAGPAEAGNADAELTLLAPPPPVSDRDGTIAPARDRLSIQVADAGGAPDPSAAGAQSGMSVAARKRELRRANSERVKLIVARSGLAHAQVNRELNRRARIRSVAEATAEELASRLTAADAWLERL